MINKNINYKILDEDSMLKAYVLGYFLADGHLRKIGNSTQVGFESKDLQLLESINANLHARISHRVRKVRTGSLCDIYGLSVSNRFAESIKESYSEYKNFTNWFVKASSQEKDEFIKGFFDGDGSVCKFSGSNKVRVIFYIAEDSVLGIIESYLDSLNVSFSKSEDTRGHKITQITVGRQIFVKALYDRWYGKVFLDRKYRVMHESLSLQGMVSPIRENSQKNLVNLLSGVCVDKN